MNLLNGGPFSRLSGGSAQSEVLPTEKKKKKSIFGKLKKLTKSRSIDDQVDPEMGDFRPIGTVSQVCIGACKCGKFCKFNMVFNFLSLMLGFGFGHERGWKQT